MRIAIVTDAWYPQRNGVVRVLGTLHDRLVARGHEVLVVSPDQFFTVPMPTYSEIRLALFAKARVGRMLDAFAPEAVHIPTEGPLGKVARAWCLRRGHPFTTAYHTKFPEYVHARTRLPLPLLRTWIRRFHAPSQAVLAPSPSVFRELTAEGYGNVVEWSHGVDVDTFRPGPKDFFAALPRPIFLYVGRVTVDKNLPAYLALDLPGSKVVVGDGPSRADYMKRFPAVTFHIADGGDTELAACYNAADAFVFPSRTDTFGLVMLEALACGVPVAAFPVTGPTDVLGDSGAGVLDEDLRAAALAALEIPPERCRAHACGFSWETVTDQFLGFLAPLDAAADREPARRRRAGAA
ncbi:glycosyltransferase family 4 protein [Caenispirillum bisanense]|uniref:Glycosyltransferase involved in cell wall bisynthesis n=1 Tax=Caenispirillum bisanense TaxID=414052 RepID=A0A286GK46_9PROT|nr:glycosyltransferase family 1 protein [Caenispirillum bisanense]SOD95908.1 Glycosyltransferase involved in cell wall bisynthesis [Caenispirillum bisanense]